jgi:hypothetical protein
VCYRSELNQKVRILSFPWIVGDVFSSSDKNASVLPFKIQNYDIFSASLLSRLTQDAHDRHFMPRFFDKLQLKDIVSDECKRDMIVTGEFGLFLFEDRFATHDVELSLLGQTTPEFDILKWLSSQLIGAGYNSVKFFNKKIVCKHDEDMSFSLSEHSAVNVKRFLYLRTVIFKNPYLLPVFYTIVHMARNGELFTILSSEMIELDTFLIYCVEYFESINIYF